MKVPSIEHQLVSTSFHIQCFITFWSLAQTRMKHWHIFFIHFKTASLIWKVVYSLVSKASLCSLWFCFLGQDHSRTWETFLACMFRIITSYSAGVWTQSLTHAKLHYWAVFVPITSLWSMVIAFHAFFKMSFIEGRLIQWVPVLIS